MDYLSFDSMASIYDQSRIFDENSFNAALDYIAQRYPPTRYPKLFEPGIGTGRIAIPMAERGYSVTGADISTEMLKKLSDKLVRRKPPLTVEYIKQDITSLPFENATFNLGLVVHVFHLIRAWKKAVNEALRILKPGAPLIMMYTGGGKEIPWIQDKYRELCTASGHPAVHIGVSNRTELIEYFQKTSCRVEIIEDRWQWVRINSVKEAFENIKARYYGMTRLVSEDIHASVMAKLEAEILNRYGSLDVEEDVPHQIRLIIVTR